jgi:NAD(P)-dependent dehydrogenase (short-subunit alcohol dehydrogenase family)
VIVTGGASGIGRATVSQLARQGYRVTTCDVDRLGLDTLCDELDSEGLECRAIVADLCHQAGVDEVVTGAVAAHGPIRVLVNVAGVMDWFLPAHEVDDKTWFGVMAVNIDAPMRLCRAVLPMMLEAGGGAIVNVGSFAGHRGGSSGLAYTVSKHAVTGLTRNIAWTYAKRGVRCNMVMPGLVKTNIGRSGEPRSDWGYERLGPIHKAAPRMAKPQEIASVISWLCSAESVALNGAEIEADGGWSAG